MDAFGFFFFLQQVAAANQLIHCAHAQFCHIFPKLLCNKAHKVDDIFGFSAEPFAKLRILCGNSYRAGIQVAHPHHHTAHGHKGCCSKSKLFCPQHRCNSDITATHQFSICFNTDFVAQTVHQQGLMGFCQAQLPGKSGIVNGTSRCCSSTSIISGNQDHLCACFCNTCCDSADTCF